MVLMPVQRNVEPRTAVNKRVRQAVVRLVTQSSQPEPWSNRRSYHFFGLRTLSVVMLVRIQPPLYATGIEPKEVFMLSGTVMVPNLCGVGRVRS